MSGIDKMKAKIKKKMTLDDLPTSQQDNHTQEELAVHTDLPSSVCMNEQEIAINVHTPVFTEVQRSVQVDRNIFMEIGGLGGVSPVEGNGVRGHSNTVTQQLVDVPVYTGSQKYISPATHTNVQNNGNTEEHLYVQQSGVSSVHTVQQNSVDEYNTTVAKQYMRQQENVSHQVEQPTRYSNEQYHSSTAKQYGVQKTGSTVFENNKIKYDRKVTWYLTEELYKAFNDIYANRMIQGRKTEKGALICEAIELLRREEYKQG